MGARVSDVGVADNRIQSVSLEDGTVIPCSTVVNASGPWCNEIQKMAGVEIPLTFDPVRIQVAYKDCKEYLTPENPKKLPITFFMNDATYFRPQVNQQQMICSTVREEDELDTMHNPDNMPRICDPEMRQQYINNYLWRFPDAKSSGQVNGISGMYTVCREDVHPAIGKTKLDGYFIANGFSGHGFKIGAMTGSLLAQQITGRRLDTYECSLDINFFNPYRTPIPMNDKGVLA